MAKQKKFSAKKKSAAIKVVKKPGKAPPEEARKPAIEAKPLSPAAKPASKVAAVQLPQEEKFVIRKILTKSQLQEYKTILEKVRDRVVDEIQFLAGDNLNRSPRESSGDLSSYSFHMADQGTDNFDREFALNLVSSEQDALYEIDDALRRIEMGTYGVCEGCNKAIEKARLMALPFAKMCIVCKSEAEKGKTRFRPFGPTISQSQTSESSS
jgi:RNA polymerase-binding transcription factor DksA